MSELIVAIDGPGGTGKSTVSRVVALETGLPHLDTGAYYRAATLAVLDAGVDPEDGRRAADVVAGSSFDQENGLMYLDGRDVSAEIRGERITAAVSAVSAHPEVRSLLVQRQRDWVRRHGGRGVVEGRDIGSVVFPDAAVKFYLDATPEVRAGRRAEETGDTLEAVLTDLNRRDRIDTTRETSPLVAAPDAIVIDTSGLTFEEVVDRLLGLVRSKS